MILLYFFQSTADVFVEVPSPHHAGLTGVSVHWGLFLLISLFKIHKKPNPIIYLLCGVLSVAGCDLIPFQQAMEGICNSTDETERRSYRWLKCVTPLSLLVCSHFTWHSISSCEWGLVPNLSKQHLNVTINATYTVLRDTIVNKNPFLEVTHLFQVNVYIYHHTNACTHTGQSKIYWVMKCALDVIKKLGLFVQRYRFNFFFFLPVINLKGFIQIITY